ncbi:MAG: hypothetical protein IKN85_05645 [Oscillospiraceae bacterium]|nr:hypothetical protein [Oscillospiraceae bacterium]
MFSKLTAGEWLVASVYPLEALYFVFLSRKCFFEKLPLKKGIAMLFLSPSVAQWLAYFLGTLFIDDNGSYGTMIRYVIISTVLLAAIQLLFMSFKSDSLLPADKCWQEAVFMFCPE